MAASSVMLASLIFLLVLPLSSAERLKWLSTIKELNHQGPFLGLITVYPPEENAFFATGVFKPHPKHPYIDLSGRRFRVGKIHGKSAVYVRCGIGMVNAAAATQQMLDLFDIVGVIHFGIAGNSNNSMFIGDVTIPSQFANTGLWDWLKPNATLPKNDVAELAFGEYNLPKEGMNSLGRIAYSREDFFSVSGKSNTAEHLFWAKTSQKWLQLATRLEGMKLEQCVNSSVCLPQKPKLVVGLKGSTSNIFVDNASYREFLYRTFHVSSVDMESEAVVKVCLSNGFPAIVIRGMSDLAGGQPGKNPIDIFGPLAALNAVKSVSQFVKGLPRDYGMLK